jgi:hypothetical protein
MKSILLKLRWSRLKQKSGHFLPDEADFFDRSSDTVKKTCEVWRKMGLFGPDSGPFQFFTILV